MMPSLILSLGLVTSFAISIMDLSHMAYLVFFGSNLGATRWCCTEERGAPVRRVAAGTIYGSCSNRIRSVRAQAALKGDLR